MEILGGWSKAETHASKALEAFIYVCYYFGGLVSIYHYHFTLKPRPYLNNLCLKVISQCIGWTLIYPFIQLSQ